MIYVSNLVKLWFACANDVVSSFFMLQVQIVYQPVQFRSAVAKAVKKLLEEEKFNSCNRTSSKRIVIWRSYRVYNTKFQFQFCCLLQMINFICKLRLSMQ